MKQILRILTLLAVIYFFISGVFALVKVYDFGTPTDYIISDATTMEIADGWVRLIPQLEHIGEITNSDPGTNLNNVEDILVEGNYMYTASERSDAIDVIDVSDPLNMFVVGSIGNGDGGARLDDPRAIVKSGDFLYVASRRSRSIEIIDVSDPANPTHAANINDGGTTYLRGTRGLTISGSLLFATSYGDDALEIIDISTPAAPFHVGSLQDSTRLNGAEGIAVSGNYAYVTSYSNDSVQVIDISTPSLPVFVGEIINGGTTLLDGAKDIVIEGNYAFVASFLSDAIEVIDISNPLIPTHVNSVISGGTVDLNGVTDLSIFTNRLLATSTSGEAHTIINIVDPLNLLIDTANIIDALPELTGGTAIQKVGAYMYISSNSEDRIVVIDSWVDSNSPFVIPSEPLIYSGTIDQGTVNLPAPDNVTYQISKDNGVTWYYLSGTTWTPTIGGVVDSNSPQEMNPEMQSFNNVAGGTWEFKWKAFLYSPGNFITEIDDVTVFYSSTSANEIIDFETAGGYTVTQGTFTRTLTNPQEGLYSIESGNNTINSTSCFEVVRDIYTDSTLEFQKTVSSEPAYDFLRFYVNGVLNSEWSGEVSWSKEIVTLGNGNYTFEWCYEKDGSVDNGSDTAWVDYIEIKEKLIVVDNVVLDFEIPGGYTVTTNVTAEDWTRVTTEQDEGLYSIESQNDGRNNTSACFERVQTVGVGELGISFYKKVSSESGWDFLIFSIDGVEQNRWDGEIGWSREEYLLSTGTYTLEWCYEKDGSVASGQDKAWIDYVTVMEDIPIISEVTQVPTPTNDTTPDYAFFSPTVGPISYSGSCSSSTSTGAIIGTNTITFDALPDGSYTDCTIQVLSTPLASNTISVNNFVIDSTGINITINYPADLETIPNSLFNMDISYDDATSGVNTGSIILDLYKWDGISAYGPDIAPTYVNFTGSTIGGTGALYPTSALGEGQYKIKFSIEDNTGNIGISTCIFYVSSGDVSPPIVIFNHPFSGSLIPNSNFILDISYSDPETGVNTGSIVGTLKKWDGISAYGVDIAPIYVNYTGSIQGATGATYPISELGFGKYEMAYHIGNTVGVSSTGSFDFYVDEPELIISTGSLDIGLLEAGITKFGADEFLVTVKTVGAGFDLILNKDTALSEGTFEIIDWDGSEGFGYEKSPYLDVINIINTDTIVATETGTINTNGDKNVYQYLFQMGGLIGPEQVAGDYSGNIRFGLDLSY